MYGVFLDLDTLAAGDLDLRPLKQAFSHFVCYDQTTAEQVAQRCGQAEVIICNKVPLGAEQLAACPKLKLVCVIATGTNNIDLKAAAELGVLVCNCTAYGTASVAQHTLALMLSLANQLPHYTQAAVNGQWSQSPHFCLLDRPVMQLSGKTLGIIGYGELGRAVHQLAQAFGMKVLISQRPGSSTCPTDRLPLAELLPQVDVLSLHCPLTEDTQKLLSRAQLASMKPGSLLINTARGGIVDEQALIDSLRSGHLGGAAMDVLTQEPPQPEHPMLSRDIPNLLLTPHMAWGSREARQALVQITADNITAWKHGEPQNCVV